MGASNLLSVIGGAVGAWLLASVIHRELHAPWQCDDECPWYLR